MTEPEPGLRKPAPGPLQLVQRFVNTNDREGEGDHLPDPEAARAWLAQEGLLAPGAAVDARGWRRTVELREAIRDLLAAHNGLPHEPRAHERINAAARRARLEPALTEAGRSELRARATGVDAALGAIVAQIHAAVADGRWERLKACERDSCRWAFYDHSKNRGSRWCHMAICGSREKSKRAYRRRRAAGRPGAAA